MGFDQDIPAPIWTDNLRVGGEGCEVEPVAPSIRDEVTSLAFRLSHMSLWPEDVQAIVTALSAGLNNRHLPFHQKLLDELDLLADWIGDEVRQ
jgi:hypothetical protein